MDQDSTQQNENQDQIDLQQHQKQPSLQDSVIGEEEEGQEDQNDPHQEQEHQRIAIDSQPPTSTQDFKTSNSNPTSNSNRNPSGSISRPAAGVGTRIRPKAIPRSSSSLRHISGKARTQSFGAPLLEDGVDSSTSSTTRAASAVQRQVDLDRRRNEKAYLQEDMFNIIDSDEEEDETAFHQSAPITGPSSASSSSSRSRWGHSVLPPRTDEVETGRMERGWADESDSDEERPDSASSEEEDGLAPWSPRTGKMTGDDAERDQREEIARDGGDEQDYLNGGYSTNRSSSSPSLVGEGALRDLSSSVENQETGTTSPTSPNPPSSSILQNPSSNSHTATNNTSTRAVNFLETPVPSRQDSLGADLAPPPPSASSSTTRPKRAPWHPKWKGPSTDMDSPPLLGPLRGGGAVTPGPRFGVSGLHTPLEGSPPLGLGGPFDGFSSTPDPQPRHRLEWQTMLESVLNSEVLRSETKRITSVDAPVQTREALMYRRWLDIRASLRGRGNGKGAVDLEEKRLSEGWPTMVKQVIAAIKRCRGEEERNEEEQERKKRKEALAERRRLRIESRLEGTVVSPEEELEEAEEEEAELDEQELQGPISSSTARLAHARRATRTLAEKQRVMDLVGDLLARVDSAEEQFPSTRKILDVVPEWGDPALQAKLAALYSWYNVTCALRLQIEVLQKWTGSETLEIAGHEKKKSNPNPTDQSQPQDQNQNQQQGEAEESTFVERILKEDSLQSTFEKRTLSALNHLIQKAKATILSHHQAFSSMALPSFEPELVQLVNFPTRLMEGALKLRLDYAGKLKEPSVLIVDSLTDDLRAALALACRIKLQYSSTMVPDPTNGWELPPCIGEGYDAVLRDALRFFFRLLNFRLKGGVFFKETEILEPEWLFLSTAVEVIEGGDVIVARSVTKIVNKLFERIVTYFGRELSAPSTTRGSTLSSTGPGVGLTPARGGVTGAPGADAGGGRGPSVAGGLTKGKVKMSLDDKAKWIHAVFDNVRIRSRKLLGFARDIRSRLDNAAEYDLASLRSSPEQHEGEGDGTASASGEAQTDETNPSAQQAPSPSVNQGTMDLNEFMHTLINAGYFLVYTESFEEEGIYLIAEPTLHDKPEMIQDLLCTCLRRDRMAGDDPVTAAEAAAATAGTAGGATVEEMAAGGPIAPSDRDKEESQPKTQPASSSATEVEAPHYLLLLTPRDAFFWTGRVMTYSMPRVDLDLKERRLRLVADGPKERLQLCKEHFFSVFARAAEVAKQAKAAAEKPQSEVGSNVTASNSKKGKAAAAARAAAEAAAAALAAEQEQNSFPLETISEQMAHMSVVQRELKLVNKSVYMLSDTIIRAVPKIRRNMRGRVANGSSRSANAAAARANQAREQASNGDVKWRGGTGGDCDELIQNCFSMTAEQAFRSLPFIESARLRGQMTLALARLAIDWVAFICDDCVPTDRKTFKWAVAALENAMNITRAENIFQLDEDDFRLLRTKVASCMALLISHFDIMGARSSVATAKLEQERAEKKQQATEDAAAANANPAIEDAERKVLAAKMVAGMGGVGAPPMLGRADSGMRATEERWVQKVMEWDAARQSIEAEQRLIGRVLDDTRAEDRSLQFLASSSSRIQIRWQQGRFIGGGTFGTVYLAVNLDSGGLMAVKEIRFQDISSSPGLYKQIKDEMNVMEMLSHPNIVEYYGIEVHRDKVYIFEEYCQGGSLAQLLEHGRIEDEAVIQIYTLQMLDGLVYLHSRDVVHRDIKPDNILLDHMGVIKFVDFGAAKVLAKNHRTVQRSRRPGPGAAGGGGGMMGADGKPIGAMQSLQGTPMYMSPEVIKGENRGRRGAMDVWSLGCVVLEFATGRRPWSQLDNEWAIMFHIGMAQQHPPLPEPGQLSDSGIDFIRQCLLIDPYERPSAAEMREHPWIQSLVDELNQANADEPISAGGTEGSRGDQSYFGSGTSIHANDSAAGVAALAQTPGFTPQTPGIGMHSLRQQSATSSISWSRGGDSNGSSNPSAGGGA